jgi:hypothetical protein
MERIKLFFGLILLTVFKILLSLGTLFFLILFSPILLFIKEESFLYYINEFNKNLK